MVEDHKTVKELFYGPPAYLQQESIASSLPKALYDLIRQRWVMGQELNPFFVTTQMYEAFSRFDSP